MESGYEFDSLSELPPLPQVYDPMEYSTSYPLESLPPFPHSDFTPYDNNFTFSDNTQQNLSDSFFLDSSLSLVTRDYLTESTQLENKHTPTTPFLHLPDLQSFEHTTTSVVEENTQHPFLSLAPPLPRHRLKSPSSSSKSTSPTRSSSSSQTKHSADRRRKKVSDKIRSLEKLMPWEKKMSLATILDETRKYITFLHSQIASLRWMPLESVYTTKPREETKTHHLLLSSLTRQQILQVIANSPGSRNVLYTRGLCLFSYEQLLSVKMMAQSNRNL